MTADLILRVVLLTDYNTRVVVFGTVMLGIAGGVIGVFLLLRRRALLADAVSHAALPGIAGAFLVMVAFGADGRSLPGLLLGALIAGLLGMACVSVIDRYTHLSEDAALGIVLSVFFGFGIALLGVIQKMRGASAAGLASFIFGKTASMLRSDAIFIGVSAVAIVVVAVFLFKELRLATFDPAFGASDGWPVGILDLVLMALVVGVTVLGMQAVGVILVIAVLIVPPAAARFWTDDLARTTVIAGAIGALGGYVGTSISALAPRLPAGAVIVTVMGVGFVVSLMFGTSRGLVHVARERHRLLMRIREQNLLRALFECEEAGAAVDTDRQMSYLGNARSYTGAELGRALARAERDGLVRRDERGVWAFTNAGRARAARFTRNHRLWETYLLEYAESAPSQVDYGADFIEHVLGEELVAELERVVEREGRRVPESVHTLKRGPA